MYRSARIFAAALALLLLAPTVSALACPPKPIRTITNLDAGRQDIRRPVPVTSTRAAWGLDTSWHSVRPHVVQWLHLRNGLQFYGSSFSRQLTPSVEAYTPEDRGWLYIQDPESTTQACRMVGQGAWQAPKIVVRETATTVRIMAASQHTVGDPSGCILSPLWGVRDCPVMTTTVQRLKRPVGSRKIQLEVFPG
jgi:hypothetical protein